jgi:hypothetical protein
MCSVRGRGWAWAARAAAVYLDVVNDLMCIVRYRVAVVVSQQEDFEVPQVPHNQVVDLVGEPLVQHPVASFGPFGRLRVEDKGRRGEDLGPGSTRPVDIDPVLVGGKVELYRKFGSACLSPSYLSRSPTLYRCERAVRLFLVVAILGKPCWAWSVSSPGLRWVTH